MKGLFIYDTRVRVKNNEIFTTGTINNETMERYLKYCNEMIVFGRREYRERVVLKTKIKNEKIKFRELPNIRSKNYLANRSKVVSILTEEIEQADFIVIRLPSDSGRIAANICKNINKDFIVEFVACPFDSVKREYYGLGYAFGLMDMYNTKKVMKKCENVIYVTEEFLQKRYPNRGNRIGCSDVIIDESYGFNLNKKLELIYRIDKSKEIQLGLIGNYYTKYKGIDVAIKAINKLNRKGFKLNLNILGEGNREKYLKLAKKYGIEDRINFCGVLSSGNEVLRWLDNIQIYIQPSYQEGMPRALIEAMSRGCPAVTSNVGGIPEIMDRDFMHSQGDYKKLAKILERIIENNDIAVEESKINLRKSKKFEKELLNEKRDNFVKKYYTNI